MTLLLDFWFARMFQAYPGHFVSPNMELISSPWSLVLFSVKWYFIITVWMVGVLIAPWVSRPN